MQNTEFQSTRPVWGATMSALSFPVCPYHFNPRAPCGARRLPSVYLWARVVISIHAPRVGRDVVAAIQLYAHPRFQSTRPVWGATNR